MTTLREYQIDEVSKVVVNRITPLFIISTGMVNGGKVLLYKLRGYHYDNYTIENLLSSSNIIHFKSSFFLPRIGYIVDTAENSLTLMYSLEVSGEILSKEDLKLDNNRKLSLLNRIFKIVYMIKRKDETVDIGVLYPYVFYGAHDENKPLYMVDCLFGSLFSNSNSVSTRNLCGFFNSNSTDDVMMSLILMMNFFSIEEVSMAQIVHFYSKINSKGKDENLTKMTLNNKEVITFPEITKFINEIIAKKKDNSNYTYTKFYEDFCDFASKNKIESKTSEVSIKEKFYKMMNDKIKKYESCANKRDHIQSLYSYLPTKTGMKYTKKLTEYFSEVKEEKEKMKKVKSEIFELGPKLKENAVKFNEGIKDYLKAKLEKAKESKDEKQKEKLLQEIKEIKEFIQEFNYFYSDYSTIINLDSEGGNFFGKLKVFKGKVLPKLFEEFTRNVTAFPKTLDNDKDVNSLRDEPTNEYVKAIHAGYVYRATENIEVVYTTDKGSLEKNTIKCEFNSTFQMFPQDCQWVTFPTFIYVVGGTKGDTTLSCNLMVDLSKGKDVTVIEREKMPFEKKNHSICKLAEYSFCVVGGNTESCGYYSLLTNTWNSFPSVNEARKEGILLLLNDINLFYFGGEVQSNSVDKYKVGSEIISPQEKWENIVMKKGISIRKCGFMKHNSTESQNAIIIFGGVVGDNSQHNNNTFEVNFDERTIGQIHSKIPFSNFTFEEGLFNLNENNKLNQIGCNEQNETEFVYFDLSDI